MEYVTSRPDTKVRLPESAAEIEASPWCNLWRNRQWPYRELAADDVLYFYSRRVRAILWRTRVVDVLRFRYESKADAMATLERWHGQVDDDHPYFEDKPESGYGLTFKVANAEGMCLPKPAGVAFRQNGWLPGDDPGVREWLS